MDSPSPPARDAVVADPLQEYLRRTLLDGAFGAVLLLAVDGLAAYADHHGTAVAAALVEAIETHLAAGAGACWRHGTGVIGLVVAPGPRSPVADDPRRGLADFLAARGLPPCTLAGGGVAHPGEAYFLDARVAELLLGTCRRLLEQAQARGGDQILWLAHETGPEPAIAAAFFAELARANAARVRELEVESRIDFLTGLANRRGFEDVATRRTEAAQRSGVPLGLIYLDSDSLKRINDTLGHDAGDRFLVEIARVLRQVVRGSDFISRWGADEFAVLMDEATAEHALALAHRIHSAVATRTEGSVSIGVYYGVPASTDEAVQHADRALYRAKKRGKNRVEPWQAGPDEVS